MRVIAGEFAGAKGPARTFTPIHVWDLRLASDKRTDLEVPDGYTAALVVLKGSARVNGSEAIGAGRGRPVRPRGAQHLRGYARRARWRCCWPARPSTSPSSGYGPFVMNTQQEIRQAMLGLPERQDGAPLLNKLKKKDFEEHLVPLQLELNNLVHWLQHTGRRMVVLFEGRDAAGKGGVISAITETLNPRQVRVVALATPTERERTQWYFQRYVPHLPAAGELVLFDRSWYNRAGVEKVMGFCTDEQYELFLEQVPVFEKQLRTTASCSTSTGWRWTRSTRKSASPSAPPTR